MALFKTDNIKKINFEAIPEEMKNIPQWFIWKHGAPDKNGKLPKIPHNLKGTKYISYTDENNYSTFDEVKKAYTNVSGVAGIGFKPKGTDITIVDVDIKRDDETGEVTGQLTASEKHILNAGYVETSVSGNGYHAIFNHKPHESIGDKVYIYDDNEHQIEVYHSNVSGWVAITGDIHDNRSLMNDKDTSKQFMDYIMDTFRPKRTESHTEQSFNLDSFIPPRLDTADVVPMWLNRGGDTLRTKNVRKIDLWHMADEAMGAYSSRSEALMALINELAYYMWDNPQGLSELLYGDPDWSDYMHDKRPQLREDEIKKAIDNRIKSGRIYDGQATAEEDFAEFIDENRSWETLQSLRRTIPQMRNEELAYMKAQFEKAKENGEATGRQPQTISPYRCAVLLNEVIKFVILDLEENTKLYMYQSDKGTYTQSTAIIKRIISWLEPTHNEKKALDVIYHLTNKADNVVKTNEPHLIPVNNGVFNRKTMELEPFTPKYVFMTKITTDYVDNPVAPVIDGWDFDNWLKEIACDDTEVTTLLWQVINEALNGNYTRKKAIFLVGDGNNAKGTFQELLINLVGFNNVTSLKVNEFDHDFKLSSLEGKTLVIGDDVPVGVNIEDSSNFNSVVTGEAVNVNVKNKQGYTTVYRCTVIQSTNGMPRFKNKSGGTNRRLLIVPFNADFNGTKENPDIKEKYLADKKVLEYVLHKAINLNFNKFKVPRVSSEMLEEFKQDNDPVYDFKVTEFDNWEIESVPKTIVYSKYKIFCEHSGYRPLSERKFCRSFEAYLGKAWEVGRPRYYSVEKLQKKIGHFEPSLLRKGDQKISYVNTKLKVV